MVQITDELIWNAENVALLMFRNNIPSRAALAKILGVSRSTVNTAFDDHWSGTATTRMIARLATHFNVSISGLVVEPAIAIARLNNGQKQQSLDKAATQ